MASPKFSVMFAGALLIAIGLFFVPKGSLLIGGGLISLGFIQVLQGFLGLDAIYSYNVLSEPRLFPQKEELKTLKIIKGPGQ